MVDTFVGRSPVARNTGKPTAKDCLVVLRTLNVKLVRVTAKSQLVVNPEDQEMLDEKNTSGETLRKLFSKMAQDVAVETLRMHSELDVTGMIYFNIPSGEMMQVLEGTPTNLAESLKHVVRDVRQDDLNFHLEKDKVTKRFQKWGMIFAENMHEWKIIRLMIPNEKEWERLRVNGDVKSAKSPRTKDSLADLIEAKRPILERFGPDAKRIWQRRDAISTSVLSPAELRFFRQRYEIARRALKQGGTASKKAGLFTCIEDPDPVFPDKIPELEDAKGDIGVDRSNLHVSVSGSRSRISVSRSNVIARIKQESDGFVETISDITDFHEMSTKQDIPKKRYNQKRKPRRKKMGETKIGQAGNVPKQKEWKLLQAIGPDEATVAASASADDYVTSLKFSKDGNCIAIGDVQGRIGIFDATHNWNQTRNPYIFYEEFLSHSPGFDALYSRRIPRNVIAIDWLPRYSRSMHLLASNEKTVKLWRLKEMTSDTGERTICPILAKSFDKGHPRFFIHSVSALCDGERFLSADELVLNIWHLERSDSCYQLNENTDLDADAAEINRIITSSKACPVHSWRFFYATSLGEVNIVDTRLRCRLGRPAQTFVCSPELKDVSEEVLRELKCVTDAHFSECGRYMVTKQFTDVQIWDLRRTDAPFKRVSSTSTNPELFDEMCTNGCLVDDFRIGCNREATSFITGSYDNFFLIYDAKEDKRHYLQARHEYEQKQATEPDMEEYVTKVLQVDWNSTLDVVAASSAHSVYIYKQEEQTDVDSKAGGSRSAPFEEKS
eukprot:CAMPEP_0184479124 /NCGR_PEP_ID=MMETSP0113_2-20130426/964_1 /TAXON_ID=91329 /ORGANISM="Norrisiella sphaerica, Strain BC52" /LENGTH=779 /DNA_ID=CAMNT_0026857133 /DNA_START=229 /DNA_END=2568 /DNA_ORIENTATION=+